MGLDKLFRALFFDRKDMKKTCVMGMLVITWFAPAWSAFATSIRPRDLSNIVASADHVIIGHITLVDMVDTNGAAITDTNAWTRAVRETNVED